MTNFRGRILQDGQPVASVEAPTLTGLFRELNHYANVYEQDGPVIVQMKNGRKWMEVKQP